MGCILVHERAGRFGSVAERERSTALGNSLKEVEELLVYFQACGFSLCLQDTRLRLMEQLTPFQGRAVETAECMFCGEQSVAKLIIGCGKHFINASPLSFQIQASVLLFAVAEKNSFIC
ncbi:hypothetical protein WN944_017452 [Citrus x changshan-huyou]|uniref:Uncharacterized protein n=1 Tax=Citrus x changshan-huyou TaxID=2935761 RepID=A0AAP0MDP1_9ROSI